VEQKLPSDMKSNPADLASQIELFFGDANEAEARIYARLPTTESLAASTISGRIIGPECRFAKTLPATIPFANRGSGPSGLLLEATIPDPCFWTPELPFLYRVIIEASGDANVEAASRRMNERGETPRLHNRWLGIRRLGTIGRSLYLDGKRWVARGACRDRADQSELFAARQSSAALLLPAPDEALCLEASRLGVPLFVHVAASLRDAQTESRRDSSTCLASEIRRLGQWPAVFAIVLDPSLQIGKDLRARARNTLFAARIETESANGALPDWALLAVCGSSGLEQIAAVLSDWTVPIIAIRHLPKPIGIADSRAACDRLQFDLATSGDFAGYFV
jgi:hypothetical protein